MLRAAAAAAFTLTMFRDVRYDVGSNLDWIYPQVLMKITKGRTRKISMEKFPWIEHSGRQGGLF
jgi:hypothetical protein